MSGATAVEIRRIVVAVDSSAPSLAAAAEIAALAARMEAELEGLFVEDINLLNLAALSFVRELGTFSATRRAVGGESLARMMRAQAARAEQALAQRATALGVRWRFQVTRGEVAPELLQAAARADLLALGVMRRARAIGTTLRAVMAATERPILLLREGVALRPPVTAVIEELTPIERMMALAVRLRFETDEIVHVWLRASTEAALQALEQRLSTVASRGSVTVEHRDVGAPFTAPELARLCAGGLLMLGVRGAEDDPRLRELVCRSECSMLLVR